MSRTPPPFRVAFAVSATAAAAYLLRGVPCAAAVAVCCPDLGDNATVHAADVTSSNDIITEGVASGPCAWVCVGVRARPARHAGAAARRPHPPTSAGAFVLSSRQVFALMGNCVLFYAVVMFRAAANEDDAVTRWRWTTGGDELLFFVAWAALLVQVEWHRRRTFLRERLLHTLATRGVEMEAVAAAAEELEQLENVDTETLDRVVEQLVDRVTDHDERQEEGACGDRAHNLSNLLLFAKMPALARRGVGGVYHPVMAPTNISDTIQQVAEVMPGVTSIVSPDAPINWTVVLTDANLIRLTMLGLVASTQQRTQITDRNHFVALDAHIEAEKHAEDSTKVCTVRLIVWTSDWEAAADATDKPLPPSVQRALNALGQARDAHTGLSRRSFGSEEPLRLAFCAHTLDLMVRVGPGATAAPPREPIRREGTVIVASAEAATVVAILSFSPINCYVYTTVDGLIDDLRLAGSPSIDQILIDEEWYTEDTRSFVDAASVVWKLTRATRTLDFATRVLPRPPARKDLQRVFWMD